jgi:uncharacterized cupredoxin-like copper-binding protein
MNGRRTLTALVVASLILATAACSSSSATPDSPSASPATSQESGQNVSVSLNQWSVTPSTTPSSGSVTFTVTNDGSFTHEFVVLKTDTSAADIPVGKFEGEPNRINEDTAGTNVGETGDMDAGTTKTLTIDLAPGHYVFLCNLPGHYQSGMHVDVTVA